MDKVLKTIATMVKDFKGASRFNDSDMSEWHIISTDQPDHLGDIMDYSGMQLPPAGKAVVLLNHDRYLTYGLPVGKALEYYLEERPGGIKTLWQKTQYSPHLPQDLGRHTYNARKEGYFTDSSINFLPRQYEPLKGGGIKYTKWDLIEAGPVLMGANWYTGDMDEPPALKDLWGAMKTIRSELERPGAVEQVQKDGFVVVSGQPIRVINAMSIVVVEER